MLIMAFLHIFIIPVDCFQSSNIFLYLVTEAQDTEQTTLGFLSEKMIKIHKYAFTNSFDQC